MQALMEGLVYICQVIVAQTMLWHALNYILGFRPIGACPSDALWRWDYLETLTLEPLENRLGVPMLLGVLGHTGTAKTKLGCSENHECDCLDSLPALERDRFDDLCRFGGKS